MGLSTEELFRLYHASIDATQFLAEVTRSETEYAAALVAMTRRDLERSRQRGGTPGAAMSSKRDRIMHFASARRLA